MLLRHNNHQGGSHLDPVSPFSSLSSLLPTLSSLTPKWRFEAPSESVSFESAATAERRPLSVTERAETRRHGEVTARSSPFNQLQIERHTLRCFLRPDDFIKLDERPLLYIMNQRHIINSRLRWEWMIDRCYVDVFPISISSVCLLRRSPSYVLRNPMGTPYLAKRPFKLLN